MTFANGVTVREPIVTLDDAAMRLVWSAEGLPDHPLQRRRCRSSPACDATRVVWIADFLPDAMADQIEAAMQAGAEAMQAALDRLDSDAP